MPSAMENSIPFTANRVGYETAMENGRSYDEVVDKAVEVVNSGISQRPDFDIDSLSDYSQMKEKLAMEVVSAEANKEKKRLTAFWLQSWHLIDASEIRRSRREVYMMSAVCCFCKMLLTNHQLMCILSIDSKCVKGGGRHFS